MDTKLKKLNLKEFIKSSPNRLQSLRLPRDLSLGGAKIPKKVFKPNVNVVRNKNKIANSKKSPKAKQTDSETFQNKQARFFQSSGIFSEGIGLSTHSLHITKVQVRQERTVETRDPVIKKVPSTIKLQHEDSHLSNVKGDEYIKCDIDEKKSFVPIQWTTEDDSIKSEFCEQKLPSEYNNLHAQHMPALTLWQLPDSLCFENSEVTNKKAVADCDLLNLPEGKIGKISVHKSGKMEVYIGDFNYELEPSNAIFSEQLVSLSCGVKTALVLGDIKNRYILSPNWKTLLTT